MAKYRMRPIEVEAVEWKGNNLEEVKQLLPGRSVSSYNGALFIENLTPNRGEMIIKGEKDKISVMPVERFNLAYEEVL